MDQRIKAVMTAILQQCIEEKKIEHGGVNFVFFSRFDTERPSTEYED